MLTPVSGVAFGNFLLTVIGDQRRYFVTLPIMGKLRGGEKPRFLSQLEADLLATEFMEALQQIISSQGQPATADGAAKLARSGLLSFDNRVPMPTEKSPPFVQALMSTLMLDSNRFSQQEFFKTYGSLFSNPPKTGRAMHDSLTRIWMSAPPGTAVGLRKLIVGMKSLAANPLMVRDQLVNTFRKNLKGKPGPKSSVPPEHRARILESSHRLRPVCRKVLEFSKNESKQPLSNIINAVAGLHPEWKAECDFLSSKLDLILRALKLAKIKKAKTRGKASKLADALACEFAGHSAGPSYSMQIVEQARRSQKT
jgi:hypothetical protein